MNGVSRFTGGRRLGQGASFSVLVFANVLRMAVGLQGNEIGNLESPSIRSLATD